MVNTINSSGKGKENTQSGEDIGDQGFSSKIDNIVNNPPVGENITVDANGMDSVRVPLNIFDADGGPLSIEIIGSSCSPGDMSEINVIPSGNTISAFMSIGGRRNLYIDYIVRDDKGNQSQTYSLNIQNLGN